MIRAIPLLNNFATSSMTSPFVSPELPRNLTDAVVVITVESISGAPTAATITPQFQLWHSVIGGNQEEVFLGGSGVNPDVSWLALTAAQNPSLLPDNDWPVGLDVSAATTGAPVMVARRISGGFPWRLSLAWALTGGTSPAMKISAIAYCREIPTPGFDRVESGS